MVKLITILRSRFNSFMPAKEDLVHSGTIYLTSISGVFRPLQRLGHAIPEILCFRRGQFLLNPPSWKGKLFV